MDYRAIAMETVRILADGGYTCGGRRVDILEECKRAVEASRLIAPEDWAGMAIPSGEGKRPAPLPTVRRWMLSSISPGRGWIGWGF